MITIFSTIDLTGGKTITLAVGAVRNTGGTANNASINFGPIIDASNQEIPGNFSTTGPIVTWGRVANATNYSVSIYKKGAQADYSDATLAKTVGVAQPDSGTIVSLDLSTCQLSAGTYQIKVIALGNGTNSATSAFSGTDVNLIQLGTPVNFSTTGSTVMWGLVTNATRYHVDIYKKGTYTDYSDATNVMSAGMPQPNSGMTVSLDLSIYPLATGTYQVKVSAVASGTNYSISAVSTFSGMDCVINSALNTTTAPQSIDLSADATAGTVTVANVPSGATVNVYAAPSGGSSLDAASNSGSTTSSVAVSGLILTAGTPIYVTITELNKSESSRVSVIALP